MSVIFYKYLAIAIAVLSLAAGSAYWGYSKGESKFTALKAELTQQTKDEQKATDLQELQLNYVTKTAYDEISTKLSSASADASRLQHDSIVGAIQLSTSADVACKSSAAPSPTSGTAEATGPVRPAPIVSAPEQTISDVVDVGLDNVDALIILQQWNSAMIQQNIVNQELGEKKRAL